MLSFFTSSLMVVVVLSVNQNCLDLEFIERQRLVSRFAYSVVNVPAFVGSDEARLNKLPHAVK